MKHLLFLLLIAFGVPVAAQSVGDYQMLRKLSNGFAIDWIAPNGGLMTSDGSNHMTMIARSTFATPASLHDSITAHPFPTTFAWASLTGVPSTFTPAAHNQAWSTITSTPTTVGGYGITDLNTLGDARWSLLAHVHTFASLTSKPTTVAGYGITDLNSLGDARWALISHTHVQSDITGLVTALAGKQATITTGTTAQYFRGDLSLATFPTSNTSFTNGAGYLTAEVDGSITNEIELPSQTGNSGKVLGTNGTSPAWQAASVGTVSSVIAGTGLSGGTITSTGTISMPNTGTAGTYSGVSTDAQGRVTSGTNRSFTNNASHTIQTVAAAGNGWQLSSTRDTDVRYSVTITTAVQIGLVTNVDGYVLLEVAATNSSTAGDWQEVGRVPQAQNVSLAIALASTQKGGGQVGCIVQAGYYVRLRSVNTSGTPTYLYNSGQEVLL